MIVLSDVAFALVLVTAQGVATTPSAPPATAPGNVPEPAGIYQGPLHGYTPSTIKGGKVIDASALATLIKDQSPILLDVAEADRKPAGMPPSSPWKPRHRSIPGATWLPGAGHGTLTPAAQAAFDKRILGLTGGDKSKPVVTYCHPDCWGSWNAAKRLILAGYTLVYWLPEGIEAWQEGHPTAPVTPDTEWSAIPTDK